MPSSPKLLIGFSPILFALLATFYLAAQTPKVVRTRDELVDDIRQMAKRHVEGQQSMDTSAVLSIYEPYTSLLSRREMAQTYESAFLEAKSQRTTGFWSVFKPSAGWTIAIILFFIAVFKTQLEKIGGKVIEKTWDFICKRFTRVRYIRKANLRRYRDGLANDYSKLKVPFLSRPLLLKEIFIPLRVMSTQRVATDIDAFAAIRDHHRLVITGNPGAGKTVLLSYITLTFAKGNRRGISGHVVPILLPLHRVREAADEESLRRHLVEELARCGMPAPKQFLDAALDDGSVMLLFDGLDEASRERRPLLVEGIKDLLRRYRNCPAIITCRSAVYADDFLEAVDEHLTIVDFQDYQILAFLHPWEKEMPEGRSVEHLMKTLRERPRILSMARNPLQLTMICSLYAAENDQFTIPHSRTEFYQRSTDLFLGTWHKERNHFRGPLKTAVLEHLGLHLHEVGGTSAPDADKRSLPAKVVLTEVSEAMKRLSYKTESDSQAILDEIVERSGLLLRIDGGARYQFAHLTIQEYYAAQALATKPEVLLKHYQTDSLHWREALRLWCGLDHDCSELVQKVFDSDPIMALECVADAQRIDDDVASTVTAYFCENVEEQIVSTQLIVREAYAAVASSPWPRGREMLEFLGAFMNRAESSSLRSAAADILAATNVDEAAKILFEARKRFPALASALVAMGDLAVPQLKELVDEDNLTAIDDLFSIGTPNAALALVPRLWDRSEKVKDRAAWALASLLARREVEHALGDYPLGHQMGSSSHFAWLWAPFFHRGAPSLPAIAGRMAHRLARVTKVPEFIPGSQLEPRLAAGVAFVAQLKEVIAISEMSFNWGSSAKTRLRKIVGIGKDDRPNIAPALRSGSHKRYIHEIWGIILQELPKDDSVACLLRGISPYLLQELTSRVFASNLPDFRNKWRTMYQPPPRRWWLSLFGAAALVAFMPLLTPTFSNLIPSLWSQSPDGSWAHIGISLAAVTLLLGCAAWIGLLLFYDILFEDYVFFSDLRIDRRSRVTKAFLFLVGPWVAFISSLIGIGMASRGGDEDRLELISLCSTIFCAPAFLASALAFFHVWGWNWLGWGAVYVGVMTTLFGIESGKALLEYSISNPLRGLRFERPTDVPV